MSAISTQPLRDSPSSQGGRREEGEEEREEGGEGRKEGEGGGGRGLSLQRRRLRLRQFVPGHVREQAWVRATVYSGLLGLCWSCSPLSLNSG